jgi:hypothetical protein
MATGQSTWPYLTLLLRRQASRRRRRGNRRQRCGDTGNLCNRRACGLRSWPPRSVSSSSSSSTDGSPMATAGCDGRRKVLSTAGRTTSNAVMPCASGGNDPHPAEGAATTVASYPA